MKTVIWILYVVLSNANGDATSVIEMETIFESKEACKQKAISMRLYSENYGCRPAFADSDSHSE